MSPVRAAMRTGAVWFLPLLFAVSCAYAAHDTFRNGYPAGDLAQSSLALYTAAPLTAAFVALRYRGFTPFIRQLRPARPGVVLVLRAYWPLLIGAPATLCLALMLTAMAVPDDLPSAAVVVVGFMTVLTAALTGLACALALPPVVAVPLSAMAWYVWIGYGPASGSTIVHNLCSTFGAGNYETRPAMVAVRATLLLLSVISVGIVVLLTAPQAWRLPRTVVAAVLVLLLVGGFGSGVAVLRHSGQQLNLMAVEPRTTPLVCSTRHGVTVCVWPENRERAARLVSVVDALNPLLRARGLPAMERLTQANRNPDSVSVLAGPNFSAQDYQATVAVGYVDHQAKCAGADGKARDQLTAAVAMLAGMEQSDAASRFGRSATTAAESALARARRHPRSVGDWFRANLPAVTCAKQR